MICPHCAKNLLQRSRSGHKCGYCGKHFALDPKVEGAGLHDVRIRRLVGKLTGAGELVCTVDQLRYAAERRGRPAQAFRGSRGSAGCLGVLGVGALIGAMALKGTPIALLALVGAALLGFAVRQVVLADEPAPPREHTTRWTAGTFHDTVVPRWKKVYSALPAGLVEDALVRSDPPVADPAFVLLCPDRTVTAFLHANHYPQRHRALLVADLRAAPAACPSSSCTTPRRRAACWSPTPGPRSPAAGCWTPGCRPARCWPPRTGPSCCATRSAPPSCRSGWSGTPAG